MAQIIHHPTSRLHRSHGVALLMVLIIVLAITIIATGFIARADVELACGENMLMGVQMNHLAESALEHARGMLLQPQEDQTAPPWTWDQQRLLEGSPDFYDVSVTLDESDPTDYCRYNVACEAYRVRNGQKVGRYGLSAVVRLDPAIALWTLTDTTFRQNWVLHGDMRTQGAIISHVATASLDGDVFASQLTGACVGQTRTYADVSLDWPPVTGTYVKPPTIRTDISTATLNASPGSTRIWRRTGDLALGGNVTVQGMLLVTGNLTVAGSGSKITAGKNLPALYVGGDLILEDANNFTVEGLAVVGRNLRLRSNAYGVKFVGGLCLGGTIRETITDVSGRGNQAQVCGNPRWATDDSRNVLRFDGTDDYVQVPHHPSLCVATEVTVMAWINTSRYAFPGQSYQGILAKGNDPRSYSLYTTSAGKLHFSTGPYPYIASVSTGTIPLNAWVHVCAMVRDGAHRYFINGQPAGNEGSGITLPGESDTAPVLFGKTLEDSREFAGWMEDVRIYNRGLGNEEVATVASGGQVSTGLVGHWQLDGPGSSVTILADPVRASIVAYPDGLAYPPVFWSPAAGAFFRSITRQLP
jgi:hypothetical protein